MGTATDHLEARKGKGCDEQSSTKDIGFFSGDCQERDYSTDQVSLKPSECEDSTESEEEFDESGSQLDLLNNLLRRKEWKEGENIWAQSVSSDPATREDVTKLADKLDTVLMENNARETGLCDVRRLIYAELFDELIREEAIVCDERGRMLVVVRDEMYRAMKEYQKLYFSSSGYGINKALEAEEVKKKLETELDELKLYYEKIQNELAQLSDKYEVTEKHYEEMRQLNIEKHISVMEFFQESNQIIKEKLVSFMQQKK